MRLAILKSFPWRIVYLVVAALLLLALAIFGSSGNSKQAQNKSGPISSKFQEENQSEQIIPSQSETDDEDEDTENSQQSSLTKVHVSVNSNTTNGETTGQASAEVTQDGQTQTFTQDLDEITDGGTFRVKVENGKFKFRIGFDQDTKNKSSIETNVEESQRTRD